MRTIDYQNTDYASLMEIEIEILRFVENGVTFIYVPALDIQGYGYSIDEAESSLGIHIAEFVNQNVQNDTLIKELMSLGWRIRGTSFSENDVPTLSELAGMHKHVAEIIATKDYATTTLIISLPL
jgi:hypothetical protein